LSEEVRSDSLPAELAGGRLEGVRLPDLMWALCRRRVTGLLEIVQAPIRRQLHLEGGRIVFASSSDPNDRLGELLLRQGRITLDQLEVALGRLRSGKRVGTLLVEADALTGEQLVQAVTYQVKTIVLDVLSWERGHYRFDPCPLPTQEAITLEMRISELLLLAIRASRSFSRIRASVGPLQTVYSLAEGWEAIRDEVRLTPAELLVVTRLQQGVASVERLCDELAVSNFEIFQALWGFRVLGLVRELPWVREPRGEACLTGRLDEQSLPELLVRAHRRGQTGVLSVCRGQTERSFHIEGGRLVFATSSEPDDGLLAFLLRRGVISLQDREETCRRLLSNKRVGTILRQLGVIDSEDLAGLVRLQLEEIVYDTFRWEQGEYVFIPGPLPSNEEITLDADLLQLVAQGIRRVDSWTRVIRGCGGVDQPLALSPNYLDTLDRMGAGVEEMDVVQALKEPQSPRRLCRRIELDDFRACQILWALRLLGAVQNAPMEDADLVLGELPQIETGEALPPVDTAPSELEDLPDRAQLLAQHPAEPHELRDPRFAAPAAEPSPIPATPAVSQVLADPTPPRPVAASRETERAVEPAAGPSRQLVEVELPAGVDALIGRFNAMHRLVYRAVRAEIGAGAINFVRACCGPAAPDQVNPMDGVRLYSDGSWDTDGLKRVIAEKKIRDPWPAYQQVLEKEFVQLAPHLGEKRAGVLQQEILALAQAIQSTSEGSSPTP
jgi:hypothetical protein